MLVFSKNQRPASHVKLKWKMYKLKRRKPCLDVLVLVEIVQPRQLELTQSYLIQISAIVNSLIYVISTQASTILPMNKVPNTI